MTPMGLRIQRQNESKTSSQLQTVTKVILGYAMSHGRLPCPIPLNVHEQTVVDEDGNCVSYSGGIPSSFWHSDGAGPSHSVLLDAWHRPIRYSLSQSNHESLGNSVWDDWVHSDEIKSVGASVLKAGLRVCVDSMDDCLGSPRREAAAVFVVYSLGQDDSAQSDQAVNQNGDQQFFQGSYSSHSDTPFDDQLVWVGKSELVYWLVKSGQLP